MGFASEMTCAGGQRLLAASRVCAGACGSIVASSEGDFCSCTASLCVLSKSTTANAVQGYRRGVLGLGSLSPLILQQMAPLGQSCIFLLNFQDLKAKHFSLIFQI